MSRLAKLFLLGFLVAIFTNSLYARWGDGFEISKEVSLKNSFGEVKVFIHGYSRDKAFIAKVENIILTDAVKLFNYFRTIPQDPIHIVIESELQVSNGMATGMPKNKMILYTYPPDAESNLLASDDWVRTLVLHELTHIIQADMTNGFLGFMRDVFGSIFKWNLYTPRWFAEGAAVWAETHFTPGGRNRYVINDLQLDSYLLQADSCRDISCLDEGATYPYQGLAYYVGGKFMEYLELKKPGTIACLITDNSDNIPFILNNAFINCIGKEIDTTFEQFIQDYRQQLVKRKQNFTYLSFAMNSKRLAPLASEALVWDKGMEIYNDQLFFVTSNRHNESLQAVNLNNFFTKKITLEDRPYSLLPATVYDRADQRYTLGVYDIDGEDIKRKWEVVDSSFKQLANIEETQPSSYLFWLGKGEYLSLRYQENQWQLYHRQGLLLSLERFRTLAQPYIETFEGKNYLIFKSYHRDSFSLEAIELSTGTRKNLYRDSRPFNLVGHHQGAVLINRPWDDSDKLMVLHLRHQSYVSEIEKAHQLARVRFSDSRVVFAHRQDPDGIYLYNGTPEQFFAWLRSESSDYRQPKFLEVDHQAEKLETQDGYTSYPQLSYFKPDYWFFAGLYGGSQREMTLFTSISDPMENHQLNLSVTHYATPKQVGGNLRYLYQLRDHTYLGLDYSREYKWSESREKSYREEEGTVYALANMMTGRWLMPLTLSYSLERDQNVATEEFEELVSSKLSLETAHSPRFYDAFLNRFALLFAITHKDSETLNYWMASVAGKQKFYLHSRLEATLSGEWERRYKETLYEGVSEYGARFGGISGGDIFGNRLAHADFNFKFLSHEIYRGWGNKPIFWRTLSPLLGVEVIDAPYAYVDDQLKRDILLGHAYFGFDFALRLGYLLDLSIIPTYGVLLNNGEGNFLLKVSGEF